MRTDAGRDVQRVLDEGLVVAGEVQVKLLGLKVLPVKVNLVVASVRRAESLGLRCWPVKAQPLRRPVPRGESSSGLPTRRNGRHPEQPGRRRKA